VISFIPLPVANGMRLAMIITLAKHVPSHITMTGHRVLMATYGVLWL